MSTSVPRYTADIDLRAINDAHILAIGRVPANCRVLDLGAADGSVAAVLKRMGCRVWGIEKDPAAAEMAESSCEAVLVADLNQLDFSDLFNHQHFDVVLMLDILEHLMNPDEVLARVGSVLADNGWGVLSIPNVAHVSLRLSLLEGGFRYTETGLLDRTHLRFYDRAGIDELLADAGWSLFDLERVIRPLGSTEIQIEDPDPELVRRFGSDREALTYQFVVTAAPLGAATLEAPPLLPAAVAQREVLEARSQIEILQSELSALRKTQIPDLHAQLESIHLSSVDRCRQLRLLLEGVQENSSRLRLGLDGG